MGVKEIIFLSRDTAISKAVDLYIEKKKNKFIAKFTAMGNHELEDWLEETNDLLHDGEGFENYLITSGGY